TLRFYEEKGLIKSIGRQGLRRQYGKQVIDQLALIALGRAAGFSLNEIATMFGQDGKPDLDRQKLKDKAEQLEQMAKRLHFISQGLEHAAVCPAENHMECPTFQKFLKAAIAGEYQPTKL
ncbi:helix-turn-helix domain-containing protein, partial [Acinetobacter baumannii]|nr:helix-turn-helix domain-containing protein [Acinetobacter baumannii]